VGGQRLILAPLHRNLEGYSPSLPYSLFHPCLTVDLLTPRLYWKLAIKMNVVVISLIGNALMAVLTDKRFTAERR